MNTTQRSMTSSSVKNIMQKRTTIPATAVGKRVSLSVQGNGNVVDVKDKDGKLVNSTIPGQEDVVLQKKIFNFRANSGIAMTNERTKSYIVNGLKAEKLGADGKVKGILGDTEGEFTAHDWFNAYLNATQMSVGIILPSAIADKLSANVEIAATVVKIDTDNGSLLTVDPSTISVLEPERFGTTAFDLSAFEETVEENADAKTTA